MTVAHIDSSAPVAESASAAAKPARVDHGQLLDHEYDGIREYDNPLPRWWVLMFWASAWFALAYFIYYHVLGKGQSIQAGYEQEQIVAREQRLAQVAKEKVSESSLAALVADPAMVADAKLLFEERCAVCHGAGGEGKIGPNLSDRYWIHGQGRLLQIYGTVSEGVPAKGMPTWQLTLSPVELRKVTAFVGSLRGKNLPGKAPEGSEVQP